MAADSEAVKAGILLRCCFPSCLGYAPPAYVVAAELPSPCSVIVRGVYGQVGSWSLSCRLGILTLGILIRLIWVGSLGLFMFLLLFFAWMFSVFYVPEKEEYRA
jgi:hypothetical protein